MFENAEEILFLQEGSTSPTVEKYAWLNESGDQHLSRASRFWATIAGIGSRRFRGALVTMLTFLLLANLSQRKGDVSDSRHGTADFPGIHDVDWSQYAYCQYVSNEAYLYNSPMIFESLVRLGARADRLMMYPESWTVDNDSEADCLLVKAKEEYGVKLMPIAVQHFDGEITWAESFTNLGSEDEMWDPEEMINETKLIHSSDWPLPKPWVFASEELKEEQTPKCKSDKVGNLDCRDREIWRWLYQDFQDRRAKGCGSGFVHEGVVGN